MADKKSVTLNIQFSKPPPINHLGALLWTGPSPHSGHSIDAWMRCPQNWVYSWGALKPLVEVDEPDFGRVRDLGPLGKGTMGHIALGHHYKRAEAFQRGTNPEKWLPPEDAVVAIANKHTDAWKGWIEATHKALRAYKAKYAGELRYKRIVGVEEVGYLEGVGRPHTRSKDLTYEQAGLIYIEDHKFVGRITKTTLKRYAMSGQFLDLTLIGRQQHGAKFGGVIVNLITWGTETEFMREPVPPAEWTLAERLDTVRAAYAERDAWLTSGADPWRAPKRMDERVCNTPYGLCEGLDLCRHGPQALKGL